MTNSTLPVDVDTEDFSFQIDDKTKAFVFNNPEAVLEKTDDFKVLIKLLGVKTPGKPRAGVDLVTVLDVSGSMGPAMNKEHEDRIEQLRTAMRFVIKKLSPIDRLSVIKFNHEANMQCGLLHIDENSITGFQEIVSGLTADGGTDIVAGLEKGLKVLDEVKKLEGNTGRIPAIMLMSDGHQDKYKEALDKVKVTVPVHTFGVGLGYNPKVLQDVAKKSLGGTFSYVQKDNLSKAFAPCLAGLLTVAVNDLALTLTAVKDNSEINKLDAGDYYPETKFPVSSATILFGNLYDQEKRTIMVDLRLPAVILTEGESQVGGDVLNISYTLSAEGGKKFEFFPLNVNISRVQTPAEPEREEVLDEERRIYTVDVIEEARGMAEKGEFGKIKDLLKDTARYLKKRQKADVPNPLIDGLVNEVAELSNFMENKDIYNAKGRAYTLSAQTSHGRQRYAARGDEVQPGGLYSTPRMDAYIKQADGFPNTPVPRADEDERREDEDATARALSNHMRAVIESLKGIGMAIESLKGISKYIQTAVESLKGIDDIINKISR